MKKDIFSTVIAFTVIVIISAIRRLKDSQWARVIQWCEEYIAENITELSPIDPILGWSWYVTDMVSSGNIYEITYEDGHIAPIIHVECFIQWNKPFIGDITLIQK